MTVIDDLKRHFGEYLSPDRNSEWDRVKTTLSINTLVEGTVIAQYEFGVFLDIGVGFPALLLVVRFRNAGKQRYSFPEDYPCIGDVLTGRVYGFSDDEARQIGITRFTKE